MAWPLAAFRGSLEALEILWNWSKEVELNTDELLLSKTTDELTAFQMAAQNNI